MSRMTHAYNSHGVFANEEEERRGAEGSGGEGRGAEGREERDKHKSSCITLPQFLAQDQCSNVSFAVFTVVAQ